jgi:hypothetical protein
MTPRQFVAVAIRIFALWLVLLSIQSLLSLLVLDRGITSAVYIAYAIVYAMLATFLWFFPMSIAGRILSATPTQDQRAMTSLSIVHAAIVCTGFVLLADAMPMVFNWLATVLSFRSGDYVDPPAHRILIVNFLIAIAQLVLALTMILRASTLASKVNVHRSEQKDGDL